VRIDRCVCHAVPFERLRERCQRHPGTTFEDLEREFRCGTGCGLCEPYVRRMMRTGQVVFHQVITSRDEPARD
jgi:bacterioferritin-associated ferredoxin